MMMGRFGGVVYVSYSRALIYMICLFHVDISVFLYTTLDTIADFGYRALERKLHGSAMRLPELHSN